MKQYNAQNHAIQIIIKQALIKITVQQFVLQYIIIGMESNYVNTICKVVMISPHLYFMHQMTHKNAYHNVNNK